MAKMPDFTALAEQVALKDQYPKQLKRIADSNQQTDCIFDAVTGVLGNLPPNSQTSLVVYGDPQSGKTEMMICLTAQLLDAGHRTIVHLMNDSVDLLMQNLERFKLAGLAPAPRNASDLANSPLVPGHQAIIFCKKNAKDLTKLTDSLKHAGRLVVIDDEADYATPNARVNSRERTRINQLVGTLLGQRGLYIGVTATPARLNLNNTFNNKAETWVHFRAHDAYTGQDVFFPLAGAPRFRLTQINAPATVDDARRALARFLVSVAHLNLDAIEHGRPEQNFSFLVHTSGKTDDHTADRRIIEQAMTALVTRFGADFQNFATVIYKAAQTLYPQSDPQKLTSYVLANASRSAIVVLNSKRDRASAGDKPTVPTCPFTVVIGGNIVSRGVSFPNLLAMFFTRDVKNKLQQDTYIQRARMFGSRGKYLEHFELTIPRLLYGDWHRCFVFHRLALESIRNSKISPVWIGDSRIAVAASSSIDRSTVDLNKGEMSFQLFDCDAGMLQRLDDIVTPGPTELPTLKRLGQEVGVALPQYLIEYLESDLKLHPGTLAVHTSSSIAGYGKSADLQAIARKKGFLGDPQLELNRFPNSRHHVKILHNGKGRARVFYKNLGGAQFVQNQP